MSAGTIYRDRPRAGADLANQARASAMPWDRRRTGGKASSAQPWQSWLPLANALDESLQHGASVVLLRVDLLDLTELAGTFGPRAAGAVLAATEARLEAFARPRGGSARDGETRFAVFLTGVFGAEEVAQAAERLCADVMAPVKAAGRELRPAVCVGAAQWSGETDVAEFRSRAEAALQEARRRGAGSQCLYTAELHESIRSRTIMRQLLQHAVAERQFRVHYQPVVRLDTTDLAGAEALVRWQHPELGLQNPAHFIPAAEETGLIVPIGAQVLTLALQQVAAWRAAGNGPPRVAVNVSGVQIRRPDFAATVEQALIATATLPDQLELELTEGALIETSRDTLDVLHRLAGLGVTLSVDDFGTGYSSLRYLRDLPVHKVKIDQTFVRNLACDSRDAAIISAVVAMSRGLGLKTVGEGVQTAEQFRLLRDIGCDFGQGWLFGKPVRPEVFESLRPDA